MRLARSSRLVRFSRTPLTFWLAVALLALVTALVVSHAVGRAEALAARYGPLRPMVVAARPVERGTALARADLAVDRLPARFVAEGAFASIEQVRGRTPVVSLLAGEPVLRGHLAPDGLSGVAALLPPGGRAVAVPTGSASPPLRKGDVVDILATFDAQAAGTTQATVAVAVDAAVVDVGAESATVAVTVEEARAVAFALAHGSVALALTPGVSAGPSPGGRALPLPPAAGRPRTG